MDNAADAALLSTTGGMLGAWFGGFIIPMAVAYILLRIAGSPKRKPLTAATLRALAVLLAAFLAYAGYAGSGGTVNPGALLAIAVTLAWAMWQTFRVEPA